MCLVVPCAWLGHFCEVACHVFLNVELCPQLSWEFTLVNGNPFFLASQFVDALTELKVNEAADNSAFALALQDAKIALDLFLQNDFKKAEELMQTKYNHMFLSDLDA